MKFLLLKSPHNQVSFAKEPYIISDVVVHSLKYHVSVAKEPYEAGLFLKRALLRKRRSNLGIPLGGERAGV